MFSYVRLMQGMFFNLRFFSTYFCLKKLVLSSYVRQQSYNFNITLISFKVSKEFFTKCIQSQSLKPSIALQLSLTGVLALESDAASLSLFSLIWEKDVSVMLTYFKIFLKYALFLQTCFQGLNNCSYNDSFNSRLISLPQNHTGILVKGILLIQFQKAALRDRAREKDFQYQLERFSFNQSAYNQVFAILHMLRKVDNFSG